MVLDEPTEGLDIISKEQVWNIIKEIKNQKRVSILLVTQDLEEANQLADEICILDNGE
jgi:ABC-type multidrug transport system ATPase subunit